LFVQDLTNWEVHTYGSVPSNSCREINGMLANTTERNKIISVIKVLLNDTRLQMQISPLQSVLISP